jgi:TonB family protein
MYLQAHLYIILFIYCFTGGLLAQEDHGPLFEGCNDPLISVKQQELCSEEKLLAYIERKIEYPDSASVHKVEGTVVARITIDPKGELIMVEILKGLNKDCNEVVLQVLRGLPPFTPAFENGKAVIRDLTIPIRFELKDLLHHKNEDLYKFHWAQQKKDSISRKELKQMLQQTPFVRDAKGLNYSIEKLELTYIKGRKISTAISYDPEEWTIEMLDILNKAKKGGVLMFKAEVQDRYKTIEVIEEFYLI